MSNIVIAACIATGLCSGMKCKSSDFVAGMTMDDVRRICGKPVKDAEFMSPQDRHWSYGWPVQVGAVLFRNGKLDEFFAPDGDCVKSRAPKHICGSIGSEMGYFERDGQPNAPYWCAGGDPMPTPTESAKPGPKTIVMYYQSQTPCKNSVP